MQRGQPVLVLGGHVGTILDQEPGQTYMTP
jgi:hypothetical protein